MTPATAPSPAGELTRLELLRAFKERLVRGSDVNLSPFALDRVIRYDSDVDCYDVPEIHREVRERIVKILERIHEGHDSQVVILAGDPGMGKSHLINHFRSARLSVRAGDFAEGELGRAVVDAARTQAIVKSYRQLAHGLKALAFCANLAHVEQMVEAFDDAGIHVAAITGQTPLDPE